MVARVQMLQKRHCTWIEWYWETYQDFVVFSLCSPICIKCLAVCLLLIISFHYLLAAFGLWIQYKKVLTTHYLFYWFSLKTLVDLSELSSKLTLPVKTQFQVLDSSYNFGIHFLSIIIRGKKMNDSYEVCNPCLVTSQSIFSGCQKQMIYLRSSWIFFKLLW